MIIKTISNSELTAGFKTLGAELSSLKTADGHEYVWQGDPGYWTGQSPLLFPIVGALPDNSYTHNGKMYSMAAHGFARKSEWSVSSHTEHSITFSLESSLKTLEAYPFRFRVSIAYSLSSTSLRTEYLVENTDEISMPFQIGAHPGFNCPIENTAESGSGPSIEDYEIVFERKETARRLQKKSILTGESYPCLDNENIVSLSHGLFDDDALIFRDLVSESVSLQRKDGKGRKVVLRFPGFTHFGIWKKPKTDAPFVCLEPWFGVDSTEGGPVELAAKEGVINLEPGSLFRSEYRIELR